jgi:threonine aldolase
VLTVETPDGKLTPELIQKVLDVHGNDEHMVQPKLVYISDSTEVGTIYKKAELKAIRDLCSANGLYLFLDGARLGSALTCDENDMTMADIASMTDCFYVGGTKNGAMLGEALVITKPELKTDFRHLYKQRGAMMAKGWIMGIQFDTLFSDGLFYKLAKHENEVAAYIVKELKAMGVRFLADSPTNQIFPILKKTAVEKLTQNFRFAVWAPVNEGEVAVRFVTSWATPMEQAQALVAAVRSAL